jgi:hypothetical protein
MSGIPDMVSYCVLQEGVAGAQTNAFNNRFLSLQRMAIADLVLVQMMVCWFVS